MHFVIPLQRTWGKRDDSARIAGAERGDKHCSIQSPYVSWLIKIPASDVPQSGAIH